VRKAGDILSQANPAPLSEEGKRGYLARELVQCTLPHKEPKTTEYIRKDGNLTVTITAKSAVGLPYGPIPRLLMLWVTSEAKRTGERKIILGNTLNQFLRDIGLDPNSGGGKRSDAKRLRNQMNRLFRAQISFDYDKASKPANVDTWLDMNVAPKGLLFWDFKQPDQRLLFDSWIELDENFFKAITANAVPVNLTMAGELKKSPLAIDLFVWLTYRVHRMKEGERIYVSYSELSQQFGTDYNRERNFKAKLGEAAEKVKTVWEKAPIQLAARGLEITGIPKSELPIPPETKLSLLSRRDANDPFSISTNDLHRAAKYAGNWDIRALRRLWQQWCVDEGIIPEIGIAHFIDFVKTHCKRNGKG
jgi:hypothetical protein